MLYKGDKKLILQFKYRGNINKAKKEKLLWPAVSCFHTNLLCLKESKLVQPLWVINYQIFEIDNLKDVKSHIT